MSKINWRWVSSERSSTRLGYLTATVSDARVVVDIYGASPEEKDDEALFRTVAARIDAHDDLVKALELVAALDPGGGAGEVARVALARAKGEG
jgi:hypothetical protein